jgi:hypothetical protein
MHSLLKHKMLQLSLKMSLYMAPTCFGPLRPSPGSIRRNLAKVTVFVKIVSKNTSLKFYFNYFNDVFLLTIFTKTVTLARFHRILPDDGPSGPKHIGAI